MLHSKLCASCGSDCKHKHILRCQEKKKKKNMVFSIVFTDFYGMPHREFEYYREDKTQTEYDILILHENIYFKI